MAVWSTERIKKLLADIDATGKVPRDNPFHERDQELRRANISFTYTQEELLELAKIQENIIYYGETYAKVMTDEGIRNVELRPYQRRTLLQFRRFRHNVYLASRQSGKCVEFDTVVNIYDKAKDEYLKLPLFRVHYVYKKKLKMDYVEWALLEAMYAINKAINYVQNGGSSESS